jgi:hypothetical protein
VIGLCGARGVLWRCIGEQFLTTWSCSGVAIALLGGAAILAACGPSFQQMAAADCQSVATDTAYAERERRLSQQLATSASATSRGRR